MTRNQLIEWRRQKKRRRMLAAGGALAAVLLVLFIIVPRVKTTESSGKVSAYAESASSTEADADDEDAAVSSDTAKKIATGENMAGRAGWNIDSSGWWFMTDDGYMYASGWKTIDGQRYYFKDDGYMATGTQIIDGTTYEFDADGKIIMKNGPYPDGFFYLNGTKVNAYQLIKYEGDYYYIGVGNKYVKNKWQYVGMPDEVFNGTDVRPWHHSFDDQGRMIGYYQGLPNGRDIGEIYNLKTTDGKYDV